MKNIEVFNLCVARVLSVLYESFPKPRELRADDIVESFVSEEEAWEPDITNQVMGRPDAIQRPVAFGEKASIAYYTIAWLSRCGYLLLEEEKARTPLYVLSPKGLEVLASTPDSLKKSYGERLAEATKGAAGEAKNKLVSEIVGQFFGAAIRSFAGG